MFVGFREHWDEKRPYKCSCGRGLRLIVNSSERPRDPADIKGADLVIFALGGGPLPEKWKEYRQFRHKGQKWLFATREPPLTCQGLNPPEEFRFDTYHWSYTYSPNASFPSPYGRYIPGPSVQPLYSAKKVNWAENKTNLISWMSSNCPLPDFKWNRRNFILKLQKYLSVDMYGKCGNLSCPKKSEICFDKLKTYKFALVLENSCCPNYISEKFWKAIANYNQVPVVFGALREEYENVAPPNSYIFIEDFNSLKDLADYLKLIDKNDTLYGTFHEWRKYGRVQTAFLPNELVYHCDSLCRVGAKLDDPSPEWNSFTFDPYGVSWLGGCRYCQDAIDKVIH